MEILIYLVFAGGIALSLLAYYVFTNLAIAIWVPAKANEKWLAILEQPIVLYFRPLIKWIVPLCLILIFINLVLQSAIFLLE
jgi:hypothetical protein